MKKDVLKSFISKYYLNGNVRSVSIQYDKDLYTDFTSNSGIIGNVRFFNVNDESSPETNTLHIYDTGNLLKVLSVLNDEFSIGLEENKDGVLHRLVMEDTKKVYFSLSNKDIIPKPKKLKTSIDKYDYDITIDDEFRNIFTKSVSAFASDVFTVQVLNDDDAKFFVMSERNVGDMVELSVSVKEFNKPSKVTFPSDVLSQILLNNPDADTLLSIYSINKDGNNVGLCHLKFNGEVYGIKYIAEYFISSRA